MVLNRGTRNASRANVCGKSAQMRVNSALVQRHTLFEMVAGRRLILSAKCHSEVDVRLLPQSRMILYHVSWISSRTRTCEKMPMVCLSARKLHR